MLYDLHVETMREAITATWGWDENWQRRDFQERFSPARTKIILVAGEVAGMLEMEERAEDLFVNNIKIRPNLQSTGIGSSVLRWVISTAASKRLPIRLQVLRANTRALAFYERLGFEETGRTETHVLMHFPPS